MPVREQRQLEQSRQPQDLSHIVQIAMRVTRGDPVKVRRAQAMLDAVKALPRDLTQQEQYALIDRIEQL